MGWWWEDIRPLDPGFQWAPGQPEGADEPANCMNWNPGDPGSNWVGICDRRCDYQHAFICESTLNVPLSPIVIPKEIQNLMNPCKELSSEENRDPGMPPVDLYMNPEKKGIKDKIIEKNMKTAHEYYTKERMEDVFKDLFPIFWNSRLPCFEQPNLSSASLIRSCTVGGEKVNCSALFTKVPTDMGLCCALNTRFTLKEGLEYSNLVKEMQAEDLVAASKSGDKIKIKTKVGKNKGLRLLLDLHSNFESLGSVPDFFRAFQVFVGEPAEYPVLHQRSLMVKPGHETNLDLTATLLSASSDIIKIRPIDRNCFFSDEGDKAGLELYQTYSYKSCVFECQIKYDNKKTSLYFFKPYISGKLLREWAVFHGTCLA